MYRRLYQYTPGTPLVHPLVLNAKDYGVPQNRERIFLVSIRDDGDMPRFFFPQPFPLERRLKDVLEENVDEKYYLSDKMLDYFYRVDDNFIKEDE